MIFNNDYSSTTAVKESPYEPNLNGALMCVYENECNYNSMMKAVGLSELKYYQETGGDLFVQEAGAFSNFIAKAKAFFKAVIEKIKGLFKKFVAAINSYVMKDKDFVKKYQKDLMFKDLTDFEFNGYKFPTNLDNSDAFIAPNISGNKNMSASLDASLYSDAEILDAEALADRKNNDRGTIINKKSSLTESEFRDEIKEMLYGGDKETLDNISIRTQLNIINDTNANIRAAQKTQDNLTKDINDYIKNLDNVEKTIGKEISIKQTDSQTKASNTATKVLSQRIEIAHSVCDDYTIFFGMQIQALKDRNRQAKAICVKALGYKPKNESATTYEGAYSDIFANVTIV